MKDSGVEWIGEIPEHWNVRRLKFTTNFDMNIFKVKEVGSWVQGLTKFGNIENFFQTENLNGN